MQLYYFLSVFAVILFNCQHYESLPAGITGLSQCHGHTCPEKTTSCFKHYEITDDKKHINVTIKCLDIHGKALETFNEEEDNRFGVNVYVKGVSLSGVFAVGNGDVDRDDDEPSTNEHSKQESKEKSDDENGLETLD